MRPHKCAHSGSDKNNKPLIAADQIVAVFAQISVITVAQKVSKRFANEVHRDNSTAKMYVNWKMQDAVKILFLFYSRIVMMAMCNV